MYFVESDQRLEMKYLKLYYHHKETMKPCANVITSLDSQF